MAREEEAGGSDVLGEEVRRDVAGALVLYCDLFALELVAHVVDLESNMRGFRGMVGDPASLMAELLSSSMIDGLG